MKNKYKSWYVFPTGYSFGTPQADQYAPQVPPPPTTPGTAPLGFAPATTPTQDLSKAPTGQPDFTYSQYGKTGFVHKECRLFSLPVDFSSPLGPARLPGYFTGCSYSLFRFMSIPLRRAGACWWYHLAWTATHAYMLSAYMNPSGSAKKITAEVSPYPGVLSSHFSWVFPAGPGLIKD